MRVAAGAYGMRGQSNQRAELGARRRPRRQHFGQRGGGLQVRILDADGQALTVEKLKSQGIIELTDNSHWPRDWPRPGGGTVPHYGGPHYGGWGNGPSE